MRIKQLGIIAMVTLSLSGCGLSNYDSKRQAAIVGQALPAAIAEAPTQVDLPKWGLRNPHVHVEMKDGKVVIYSTDQGWNGKYVDVYYVPYANVEMYNGDYMLRSKYSLQRIAVARMKPNQTWSAMWDTKGFDLPKDFFILVRTSVGEVTVEHVIWSNHQLIDGGAEAQTQ